MDQDRGLLATFSPNPSCFHLPTVCPLHIVTFALERSQTLPPRPPLSPRTAGTPLHLLPHHLATTRSLTTRSASRCSIPLIPPHSLAFLASPGALLFPRRIELVLSHNPVHTISLFPLCFLSTNPRASIPLNPVQDTPPKAFSTIPAPL